MADRRIPARRAFVGAVVACALGDVSPAHGSRDIAHEAPVGAGDIAVLNALLAVEHATLATYRRIAACGLVSPALMDVVARCAADHRAHAELFAGTVLARGGRPLAAARAEPHDRDALGSEAEALDLAARVELAGANACLRMLPSLKARGLAKLAARVAADETMHWTLVNAALRRPPPPAALWFGT